MSMRKYGITRGSWRSDQRWGIQGGQDIKPGLAGSVTAYDARDVDPLLRAARDLIEAADRYAEGASFRRVRDGQKQLNTALAPFDGEEKT